jgi:hypothetical protein
LADAAAGLPNVYPPEASEYRLGNRPDEPEYIVRLLGQVTTASLETVNVVKELLSLDN